MNDPIDEIAGLFSGDGMRNYFGEAVSVSVHMLQAAALAEADGAGDHLVAAALLHDIGHVRGVLSGHDLMSGAPDDRHGDDRHEETGATWLAQWFPGEVTEPVRLHVAAKRYLCAVDPEYRSRLSPASVSTLEVQGGPMTAEQAHTFASLASAEDAIAVRRWDEAAKDPAAATPDFDHFRPMLQRLLRKQ